MSAFFAGFGLVVVLLLALLAAALIAALVAGRAQVVFFFDPKPTSTDASRTFSVNESRRMAAHLSGADALSDYFEACQRREARMARLTNRSRA